MQAQPVGGGSLLGAGRMWVAQTAEADPRAVKVWLEGHDLPAESLVKRYLPEVGPHLCLLCVQPGEVGSSRISLATLPIAATASCSRKVSPDLQ